jgi:hypothetical protein
MAGGETSEKKNNLNAPEKNKIYNIIYIDYYDEHQGKKTML